MARKEQIRLSHLKISNYKKIDSLEIDFPPPLMQEDPDILLLGSKNGGGKTSVLECCSLSILLGIFQAQFTRRFNSTDELPLDIANLLVKAGQETANIEAKFEGHNKQYIISLAIDHQIRFSESYVAGDGDSDDKLFGFNRKDYPETLEYPLNSIFAFSSEPLIIPPLLHFNSYRKVQESNPELGMMADDYPRSYDMRRRNAVSPISSFKLEKQFAHFYSQ